MWDLATLWYNGKSQIERGSEMDAKLRYKAKKIKIVFFDRYGDVIEEKIEKMKVFDFTYPDDTQIGRAHV